MLVLKRKTKDYNLRCFKNEYMQKYFHSFVKIPWEPNERLKVLNKHKSYASLKNICDTVSAHSV